MKNIVLTIGLLISVMAAQAQSHWKIIDSVQGGFYTDIHFWNANEGIVCGKLGGIFLKTSNGGQTWDTVSIPHIDNSTDNFNEMMFVDRNLGFACGGSGFSSVWNMLLRTTDGGNTWDSVIMNYPSVWEFQDIDFNITDNKLQGVISTYQQVFKVTDSGKTITAIPSPVSSFQSFAVAMNGNRLFVSDGKRIYYTDNWGNNWTNAHTDTLFFGKMAFQGNHGIAIGEKGYVLKTDDFGNTWTKSKIASNDMYFYTVKFAPNGYAYMLGSIATSYYVLGTEDFGKIWKVYQIADTQATPGDISMPARDTGYIATSQKIYKTTTGGGLSLSVSDIKPLQNDIAIYPNPANDMLHIQMPAAQLLQHVSITDMQGKIVEKWQGNRTSVNVGHLSPGMYIINLQTTQGSYQKQLTVR